MDFSRRWTPDLNDKIADLANRTVNRSYSEDDLAQDIRTRLQIA